MEKVELRKKYLKIRSKIKDKDIKSKIILEKLIAEKEYQKSRVIGLYKSLESEVNTAELIQYSLDLGKIVVLPRVVGNDLIFYQITAGKKLNKSKFGVEEPEEDLQNLIDKNQIDLVIVPGVAFDQEKNRLGFGKGYYDRFLADMSCKIIGICFEEQVLENELLPVEENDIKMQKLITEKNVY